MPRPRKLLPSLLFHRASGQAYVNTRDDAGKRHPRYLGPWGSQEAQDAYVAHCAAIDAGQPVHADTAPPVVVTPHAPPPGRPVTLTVRELVARHAAHAAVYYRHPDGEPTGEARNFVTSTRDLLQLYGETPAHLFTRDMLKQVRAAMVRRGVSREVVNQRVGRIVHIFRWAVDPHDGSALIPESVVASLVLLRPLARGRSEAPEREDVKPVPWEHVEKTLPKLAPVTRAMVQLLRHSVMRPGEVCRMKPGDVERAGETWTYRPGKHKTLWRGRRRVVALGPKAQAVLRPWLDAAVRLGREYVFPPSREATRGQSRPCYTSATLYTAVRRAAKRAGVPAWTPNQIRHAGATEIRHQFGLEATQVVLGHSKADTTQLYAEKNESLAAKIAAERG
jgi:integrase